MSGAVSPVFEALLWWVVTAGVWTATLTTATPTELAVAAAATLPCAVAAGFARRANGGRWRVRLAWLAFPVTVLAELPRQTLDVWVYALIPGRRRCSTISRVVLPAEPEPVAAARRAVALLALATTPGTVVLDSSSRRTWLLLHRVGPRPGGLEGQVSR